MIEIERKRKINPIRLCFPTHLVFLSTISFLLMLIGPTKAYYIIPIAKRHSFAVPQFIYNQESLDDLYLGGLTRHIFPYTNA